MPLKLYVWEGVLTDWTDGIIFALAASADAARAEVLKKYDQKAYQALKAGNFHDVEQYGSAVWRAMKAEPDVYDEPVGFYLWGGS